MPENNQEKQSNMIVGYQFVVFINADPVKAEEKAREMSSQLNNAPEIMSISRIRACVLTLDEFKEMHEQLMKIAW